MAHGRRARAGRPRTHIPPEAVPRQVEPAGATSLPAAPRGRVRWRAGRRSSAASPRRTRRTLPTPPRPRRARAHDSACTGPPPRPGACTSAPRGSTCCPRRRPRTPRLPTSAMPPPPPTPGTTTRTAATRRARPSSPTTPAPRTETGPSPPRLRDLPSAATVAAPIPMRPPPRHSRPT